MGNKTNRRRPKMTGRKMAARRANAAAARCFRKKTALTNGIIVKEEETNEIAVKTEENDCDDVFEKEPSSSSSIQPQLALEMPRLRSQARGGPKIDYAMIAGRKRKKAMTMHGGIVKEAEENDDHDENEINEMQSSTSSDDSKIQHPESSIAQNRRISVVKLVKMNGNGRMVSRYLQIIRSKYAIAPAKLRVASCIPAELLMNSGHAAARLAENEDRCIVEANDMIENFHFDPAPAIVPTPTNEVHPKCRSAIAAAIERTIDEELGGRNLGETIDESDLTPPLSPESPPDKAGLPPQSSSSTAAEPSSMVLWNAWIRGLSGQPDTEKRQQSISEMCIARWKEQRIAAEKRRQLADARRTARLAEIAAAKAQKKNAPLTLEQRESVRLARLERKKRRLATMTDAERTAFIARRRESIWHRRHSAEMQSLSPEERHQKYLKAIFRIRRTKAEQRAVNKLKRRQLSAEQLEAHRLTNRIQAKKKRERLLSIMTEEQKKVQRALYAKWARAFRQKQSPEQLKRRSEIQRRQQAELRLLLTDLERLAEERRNGQKISNASIAIDRERGQAAICRTRRMMDAMVAEMVVKNPGLKFKEALMRLRESVKGKSEENGMDEAERRLQQLEERKFERELKRLERLDDEKQRVNTVGTKKQPSRKSNGRARRRRKIFTEDSESENGSSDREWI